MNACEKMQIARLNLRAGRGRSLADQTRIALKQLRRERNTRVATYVVMIDGASCACTYSLRQARLWQLRSARNGCECGVYDSKTGIQIY